MLTRAAPRLARPIVSRVGKRFNTNEVPKPPPGAGGGGGGSNLLPIGLALGAGGLGYYYFMDDGKVEQKVLGEVRKTEARIIEREHQASKDQVTSME